MTIEEFIEARLDEDEQIARTAAESFATEGRRAKWSEQWSGSLDVGDELFTLNDSTVTRHAERHDPARVLRQVAAVWGILESWRAVIAARNSREDHASNTFTAGQDAAAMMWLGDVLQRMAAIWSDHPDYRPEWSA